MSAQLPQALEVFCSYAHEDEALRDTLVKHLSPLQRQGVITAWHDRKITAGTEWAGAIDAHLQSAQIILMLVSADFMASDYCYDVEMQRAMERHEAREARVIPVILRPVDWQGAPFGKLQALPTDGKPITNWPNQDAAFVNVARGIRAVAQELTGRP
jgi:TIR domain